MIRRAHASALGHFAEPEVDPSPMEMVANVSDVMLVLAVALMVALIARMGVDFSALQLDEASLEEIESSEFDTSQASNSSGDGQYEEVGRVYRNSDGDMYLLSN